MTDTATRPAIPALMTVTDAAASRLRHLYGTSNAGKLLRISVGTKGCSGLSYQMDWVESPTAGDEEIVDKDVRFLIDRKAVLFLIGTEMDFKTENLSSSFVFSNPNEKGRCGCGESFHI